MADGTEVDELQVLNAYIEFLRNQGRSNHDLSKCKHFLRYLLTSLRGKPKSSEAYRVAADYTLSNFPIEDIFIEAVREFFYYWSGTARPNDAQRPVAPPRMDSALPVPLAELLTAVANDHWFKADLDELELQWRHLTALRNYGQHLKLKGCDEVSILARVNSIRPLLFVMRGKMQSAENYRSAVDGILLMLPRTDRWAAFVGIAREFFYFWAHQPDAAEHLQLSIRTSDIREIYNT